MLGASATLPWGLAWRLAAGQIVSWGILYYAFTVVAGPLHTESGWTHAMINAGLSLGLLIWGIAAFPIGRWIQRHGVRGVMALSSGVGGAALVVMGFSDSYSTYLVAWVLLGASMAGCLYDAAFAAVTRAFGPDYRRGSVLITLVGGFASTVFVPLSQYLVSWAGWREALIVLGTTRSVFGAALHAFGIPRFDRPLASLQTKISSFFKLPIEARDPCFWGLTVWFSAHAAAATGLVFLFVPLLQAEGVQTSHIVHAIAVMGPMQVAGRFVLTTYGGNFSAVRVGAAAMAFIGVSILILLVAPWHRAWLIVFAALFGLGNGILTILRGTSVAEFFGTARYAEINGALSASAVITKALAPLMLGAIWSSSGSPFAVIVTISALTFLSGAGLGLARYAAKRNGNFSPQLLPTIPEFMVEK
jgi:MFS family permease